VASALAQPFGPPAELVFSLRQVTDAFCSKRKLSRNDVHFLFDGQPLPPDSTLAELGLSEGDAIDAFMVRCGD
jgi:hypothetical protein